MPALWITASKRPSLLTSSAIVLAPLIVERSPDTTPRAPAAAGGPRLVRGGALRTCPTSLQAGVAQRPPAHLPGVLRAPLSLDLWRCRGQAFPSAAFGSHGSYTELREHAFRDFQLIQVVCQPSPFRVEPGKPFGNALLLLSNLVQCRHMHFPPDLPTSAITRPQ